MNFLSLKEETARSMTFSRHLFIAGAGGHAREVACLAQEFLSPNSEIVHLVTDPRYLVESLNGLPVRLVDSARTTPGAGYVAAVGDVDLRASFADICEATGLRPISLIHPSVSAYPLITLGEGSVVCAGSVLTTNIRIARHVHINIGCMISHDVRIGDFSTLSPGCRVSGNVHIGTRVFLGAGAVIINGAPDKPLLIGDGAVVAAGACVIRDVAPHSMVAGVPAQRKR